MAFAWIAFACMARATLVAAAADTACAKDGSCEEGPVALLQVASPSRRALGDAQASAEVEVNRSGPWWGSKYDAKCFHKMGSDHCNSNNHDGGNEGSCTCKNGCVGADGSCHVGQENRLVAQGFRLKNYRWPDHYLYIQHVSAFDQLSVSKSPSFMHFGADKFKLYELPNVHDNEKKFFLASQKWPAHVVGMAGTGQTAMSLWGAYAMGLGHHHEPWALEHIMLTFCSLRQQGYKNAVKVGTAIKTGDSSIWMYAKEKTWLVYGYWYHESMVTSVITGGGIPNPLDSENPGEGGYWVMEPELPEGTIPDCI